MKGDIEWVLNEMSLGANNGLNGGPVDQILIRYGDKWKDYFSAGKWQIFSDPFWTYPHDFSLMKKDDKSLYSELADSHLIIFKGDLNYRKLVGDLKWKPTDTFEESLQGFHPAPLVALRTLVSIKVFFRSRAR